MKIVTQSPLIMQYRPMYRLKGSMVQAHSRPIVLNGLSYGIVRFVRFLCSEMTTKWRHIFLTVYVNGRDQQSIVTRQRVTHTIQPPPPKWRMDSPEKTFSINENIQVDPICVRFMAKISEICKETNNRRFSLDWDPKIFLGPKMTENISFMTSFTSM